MSSAESGFGGVLARSTERYNYPNTSNTVPKRKVKKPKKAKKVIVAKQQTAKGKKKARKAKKPKRLAKKAKKLVVKAKVAKRFQPKLFI